MAFYQSGRTFAAILKRCSLTWMPLARHSPIHETSGYCGLLPKTWNPYASKHQAGEYSVPLTKLNKHKTWGPLARGMRFNHARIKEVANKKGKSPAQIFLRWNIQKVRQQLPFSIRAPIVSIILTQGHAPIPKSARKDRILENAQIFDWELSDEDMASLEDLNEGTCLSVMINIDRYDLIDLQI